MTQPGNNDSTQADLTSPTTSSAKGGTDRKLELCRSFPGRKRRCKTTRGRLIELTKPRQTLLHFRLISLVSGHATIWVWFFKILSSFFGQPYVQNWPFSLPTNCWRLTGSGARSEATTAQESSPPSSLESAWPEGSNVSLPAIELDYRPPLTDKGKFIILHFEAPRALQTTHGFSSHRGWWSTSGWRRSTSWSTTPNTTALMQSKKLKKF